MDKFWLAVRVTLQSNSCSVTLFSCDLSEFAKHISLLLSWKTYHILKRGLAGIDQGAICITANWASDVTGQGPGVLSSSCPLFSLCSAFMELGVRVCAQLLQLRPTLCNSMGCSPPGSSVHGILQERTLEWVAMPSSRGP